MLLKYIVSNYKSIGHPIEFSMFPTETDKDERFLKTITTKAGDWKILQRGCFFGPNAAGKSSFIESLNFMRNFIVNGQRSGKGININQFRGEFEELKGISTFQIVFFIDGDIYEYGFSVDRRQIYEEWLMIMTENDFAPIFIRETDEMGKTQINILGIENTKERNLAEVLKISIQENQKNQLFLYKLYDNGIRIAEKIVDWFRELQFIFPDTNVKGLPLRLQQDTDFKTFIAQSLERMDTGVFDLSIASDEMDFHEWAEKQNLPSALIEEIEDIRSGIVSLNGKYFIFGEGEKSHTVMIQIRFEHRLNNKIVSFNIEDESDGTQRLLDLLPILFAMKEKRSSIYFVDEIDRSLHTKLSQHLLNEFINESKNICSQIIFTAHDVNLINLERFRQEEIWFIEKNSLGESRLKPLSDFRLKEGQDALKAYLSGRFGAVPMIGR